MSTHILQTKFWGDFKEVYGTRVVRAGGVQYTLHDVPFTSFKVAYCPRVNPEFINFEELQQSLINNNCTHINFDVPNILKSNPLEQKAIKIFTNNKCRMSPRDTFAKGNFYVDLKLSEDDLLAAMHSKRRYNIRLAEKKGVTVRDDGNFNDFYKLLEETASAQKYFIHPRDYYENVWKVMGPGGHGKAHILTAYFDSKAVASWMLFAHDEVLYYPYGGSSLEYRDLHASELLGWEVMRFGKLIGCELFDMWGAAEDTADEGSEYYGFTLFKMRFGGKHVVYMDSYDYVVMPAMYQLFTSANELRWKVLGFKK